MGVWKSGISTTTRALKVYSQSSRSILMERDPCPSVTLSPARPLMIKCRTNQPMIPQPRVAYAAPTTAPRTAPCLTFAMTGSRMDGSLIRRYRPTRVYEGGSARSSVGIAAVGMRDERDGVKLAKLERRWMICKRSRRGCARRRHLASGWRLLIRAPLFVRVFGSEF